MTNYTLKWQRILQWHNKITDYTLEQQHNKLYTETPQQNYALKQQHKLCNIIAEEEKEEEKKQKQRRRDNNNRKNTYIFYSTIPCRSGSMRLYIIYNI